VRGQPARTLGRDARGRAHLLESERQAQATPLRVEQVARDRLGMRTASAAVTLYVEAPRAAR
jgi:hypothetical protein